MKNRFKHKINHIAVWMAIASFIVGTALLVTFKIYGFRELMQIGFSYLTFAYAINSFALLLVLINSALHIKDFKEHLATAGIMLLNIPISNWYWDIAL